MSGVKIFASVGQHGFAIDYQQQSPPLPDLAVGNPINNPTQPGSQHWKISPKSGANVIEHVLTGLYLAVDASSGRAVLEKQAQLWDIVAVGDHHKIQVHNVGTVLSLNKSERWTPVLVENYTGSDQQWDLRAV